MKADWEWGQGRRHDGIEVYGEGRYFTMTGQSVWPRDTIAMRHGQVEGLIESMPTPERIEVYGEPVEQRDPTVREEAIAAFILKLATTGNNPKAATFNDYWHGEGDVPSASEGDFALAHMLAHYAAPLEEKGEDPIFLIDLLFRESGRYRQKWERADYAGQTIARAIDHVWDDDDVYGWAVWDSFAESLPAADVEVEEADRKEVLANVEAEAGELFGQLRWGDLAGPFLPPTWLWEGRIPQNELTILGGNGDVGKSTLLLDCAAQLSRGELPGEMYGEKGRTLILTDEADFDRVIQPRYAAAEGVPGSIGTFEVYETLEGGRQVTRPFYADDIELLLDSLESNPVDLIIVDPVDMLIGGGDSNNSEDVRGALSMLLSTGTTVVGIRHFNKSSNQSENVLMGSAAFRNYPRSVLLAKVDPKDDTQIVLAHGKCNVGPRASSLRFRIVDSDLDGYGRIEWLGEDDRSAAQLIAQRNEREPSVAEQAAETIRAYIEAQGGEANSRKVKKMAAEHGISKNALYDAKHIIGVEVERKGHGGSETTWRLADDD